MTPRRGDVPAFQRKAAKKAPLGSGERFEDLTETLSKKGGVRNPKALAAAIGRKKYGKKRFGALGKKGKKRKAGMVPAGGGAFGKAMVMGPSLK
jgi:hypothetical protein